MSADTTPPPRRSRLVGWVPFVIVAIAAVLGPMLAPSGGTEAGADDETLRSGADLYSRICQSCHQPGGAGVPGQFPPLNGNPNVQDSAYVEGVIRNGRTGEIVVDGVTYDSVMPPQGAGLSDADIADLIVYIQSGFQAPSTPAPEVDTGPVAGTDLPALADYAYIVAFLIAIGLGALVLGPRVIASNERTQITWVDAWMKTAVIVIGLILATTLLPAKVLEIETVQDLPREAQDLIAVSIWVVAIVASAWALWYAHREKRV